jgi:hypothetical protein
MRTGCLEIHFCYLRLQRLPPVRRAAATAVPLINGAVLVVVPIVVPITAAELGSDGSAAGLAGEVHAPL